MKGQVAIENLMTYGWMLLSIAIVSGSVLNSGAGSFCSESVQGFGIHQLKVEEFGYSSGDLNIRVLNDDTEDFEHKIEEITVNNPVTGENETIRPSSTVEPNRADVFSLNGFTQSENCRKMEVSVRYDRGSVLEGQVASGSFSSYIKFDNSAE